jgi:polar amino acid transport system substrate-binding protein
VQAQDQLKIAGFETLSDPLIIFDKRHQLVGGLLKDYTDAIARGLDAKPVYLPYSRRRIEPAVVSGEADLVCYHSPQWVDQPTDFAWTIPNLPQTERVVVRKETVVPNEFPDDLQGKKIATQIGILLLHRIWLLAGRPALI